VGAFFIMSKNIRYTLIRVGIGALAVLFLLAFMTLAGCTSGTKDIARAAGNTQTLAAGIIAHTEALAPLVAEHEQAASHVKGIAQNARDIQIEAGKVQTALPKVEDKTPWWATALGNLTWIALIVAAAVLAIKFWPVLAVFLAGAKWLEWLIPKPTRIAAERDYELYREADEPHRDAQRDRILAARMNPYYDAAWRRAERKARLGAKA
jgi:hypothetical protein